MRYIPPPLPGDPSALRGDAKELRGIAGDLRSEGRQATTTTADLKIPAARFRRLVTSANGSLAAVAARLVEQAQAIDKYADQVEESIDAYQRAVEREREIMRNAQR